MLVCLKYVNIKIGTLKREKIASFTSVLDWTSFLYYISIKSFIAKYTLDMIEINFVIYDILWNMECVLHYIFSYIASNCP